MDILSADDRLLQASELAGEINGTNKEEVYDLLSKHNFESMEEIQRAIRAMAYIKLREIDGETRVNAFKIVFPDRWSEEDTDKKIANRARRIESTVTYKKVIEHLELSFYALFSTDRIIMLNTILERAFDKNISEKGNLEYSRLFLEYTKKPESAQKMEVDVNVSGDGKSIRDIEDKLGLIADSLFGRDQKDIIEIVAIEDKHADTI